jgi:putative ABC transport system permease protein
MIRHHFIAALRNMAANRLISAIAILGLAVGIAAALLMALVMRNQMSFDHFIPGYDRTYALFHQYDAQPCAVTPGRCHIRIEIIDVLKQRYPAIEAISRLNSAPELVRFQQGNVTGWESFFWTDSALFAALPLPVLHGTLRDALSRPDDVVLTRAMARKYFGRDDVVGRTLTVAGYPMTVRAVLRDLPGNATNLDRGIFISNLGAPKPARAGLGGPFNSTRPGLSPLNAAALVYVRLKPGAVLTQADTTGALWAVPGFGRMLQEQAKHDPKVNAQTTLLPLDRIHLWEPLNPGVRLRVAASAAAGTLVLLIAAINFANLMVAGAIRREREVGIRKACGSGRGALMLQFLGEAMIAVAMAGTLGVALTEWLLPPVNAFLRTGAVLSWHDPLLLGALLAGALLLALAIGAWPSIILSGFNPVSVLRGWTGRSSQNAAMRSMLVTLQFAVLIALAIVAAVVWMQRDFAARDAMRVDSDQMLLVQVGATDGSHPNIMGTPRAEACSASFADEVRKLPGVRGVACSGGSIFSGGDLGWYDRAGRYNQVELYAADPRLFALYGVKPVAGALPQADGPQARPGTVINMAAARKFGVAPQALIGKSWTAVSGMAPEFAQSYSKGYEGEIVIAAVVPDFSFAPVTKPIAPTLYLPLDSFGAWDSSGIGVFHVKLSGRDIPETLAAIDRLWARSGINRPMNRFFLNNYMQQLYQDMTRDAQFFAGCTVLAIILACLGLFGIAIATAERRTKEIGVRKAMGADNRQIVALLLWQFAQPVLWANVIAWPVAWWLMRRWLSGFAYHVDLHWWVFAGASLGALVIALLTVAGQAWATARARPVLALRYE